MSSKELLVLKLENRIARLSINYSQNYRIINKIKRNLRKILKEVE